MKIEKTEKLAANLHDRTESDIYMKNSKQALNHELVFKKVYRVIKFNIKSWLKSYMEMNTDLGKAAENDFEKELFKLMNKSGFGKTMEMFEKIET